MSDLVPAQPKVVVLDIETAPHDVWSFEIWNTNINLKFLKRPTFVLCFAAKWLDSNKVEYFSVYHHSQDEMVQAAWDILNEADVVVTYNGKAFDNKHLRQEFLLAGLAPPSPWADVDLLQVVKRNFRFASNKLDYVAQQLGLGGKVDTGGADLWVQCMSGDEKAWNRMRKYNMRDVRLTERVYLALLPWISGHPNVALWTGQEFACPTCSSENVQKRGFYRTATSTFQRFQCQDCGKWSRASKRLATTELR